MDESRQSKIPLRQLQQQISISQNHEEDDLSSRRTGRVQKSSTRQLVDLMKQADWEAESFSYSEASRIRRRKRAKIKFQFDNSQTVEMPTRQEFARLLQIQSFLSRYSHLWLYWIAILGFVSAFDYGFYSTFPIPDGISFEFRDTFYTIVFSIDIILRCLFQEDCEI